MTTFCIIIDTSFYFFFERKKFLSEKIENFICIFVIKINYLIYINFRKENILFMHTFP